MELRDYVRILLRRGWIIVLVAAVAAVSALGFSLLQPTIYRASIIVKVQPARLSDWGQTQAIKDILNTFTRDILTERMAARVGAELKIDLLPRALLEKIHASPDVQNYEIRIDADDRDPLIATRIVERWAYVFKDIRDKANLELDQRDRVLVDTRDLARYELYSPKKRINVVAGGVLGALLGTLIVLALEYLEAGTIRSTEDVERTLGVAVLGAIPPMTAPPVAAEPAARRWWQVWQRA